MYSLEYVQDVRGYLHPTVNEIPFTYLPEGSEIISIDAFNKSENKEEMVVGFAIVKVGVYSCLSLGYLLQYRMNKRQPYPVWGTWVGI